MVRDSIIPRKRPEETKGTATKVKTGCGNLYVQIGHDTEGPCEVVLTLGKTGACATAMLETIGRLISLNLRSGVSYEAIVKQLKGIRCPSIAWDGEKSILSCADGVAGVLQKHLLSR